MHALISELRSLCVSLRSHRPFCVFAEAPCSGAVRAARAVVSEVPAAASTSIGALAACKDDTAEHAVHKLAEKFKLTLPVKVCTMMGALDERIPVVPLSSWANFFVQKNLFFSLSGLSEPDAKRSASQWTHFWKRYKALHPRHPVFNRSANELARTAAILVHGDEGRSRKKKNRDHDPVCAFSSWQIQATS